MGIVPFVIFNKINILFLNTKLIVLTLPLENDGVAAGSLKSLSATVLFTSIFLPAMLWKFFKSNWFSVVLVCIVLLAIVRKGLHVHLGTPASPAPVEKLEKFTDSSTAAGDGTTSQLGFLSGLGGRSALSESEAGAFLKRFSAVAISEKRKYGIPASVMLATAFVNSHGGRRQMAVKGNNFFALSCSGAWEGVTATYEGKCFRKYETPWESFRDFSVHLSSQDWFGPLRKSAGKNWQAWVGGLHPEDISDVPHFTDELTRVIQAFRLYDLDTQ